MVRVTSKKCCLLGFSEECKNWRDMPVDSQMHRLVSQGVWAENTNLRIIQLS